MIWIAGDDPQDEYWTTDDATPPVSDVSLSDSEVTQSDSDLSPSDSVFVHPPTTDDDLTPDSTVTVPQSVSDLGSAVISARAEDSQIVPEAPTPDFRSESRTSAAIAYLNNMR